MLEYPKLSGSCSFHRYDNGGGAEEYVLASADGRQFKVSALARRILERLDGRTHIDQIAADLASEGVPVTPEQLRTLLEQRYASLGVLEDGTMPAPPAATASTVRRPGFPVLLTWTLVPQRAVVFLAALLRFFYAPAAVVLSLGLIVWAHAVVYSADFDAAALSSESYLWITALCLLSILFHELGHAAAVSRFGGVPGRIGCGLYILMPTFYADVSQLWRFPRRHRMVVDLGGAYFQQIAFALLALGAVGTGSPELLATCRLIDLMVLTALNPLFHFDGYWFLADYLAVPKLQSVAFRSLAGWVRRLLGRPAEVVKLPPLSALGKVVFLSYSVLAGLFLAATVWLVYRYLSTTFIQFPVVAPQAFHAAAAAWDSGDIPLLLVRSIALFFLAAFPATAVIGLILVFARLARLACDRLAHLAGRPSANPLSRRLT
jgi:putative peptide zinc metalloprotease protein